MTTAKQQALLVETLYNAYVLNQTISTDHVPDNIDKQVAYETQHLVTDKKVNLKQDKLIGYKISLTSKETQLMFGSSTPLYGALTQSSLSQGIIELDAMNAPLIEIELMFIANEDISPSDDEQAILQKMSIAPGLEIPDSRFTNWFPNLSFGQVIADSAVAGSIVVGKPIKGLSFDQLGNITADLQYERQTVARGPSSEVLGNPVHAIKWLIDELDNNDRVIEKGMIISSGTFMLPKPLEKGKYVVQFDHLGEVNLEVV